MDSFSPGRRLRVACNPWDIFPLSDHAEQARRGFQGVATNLSTIGVLGTFVGLSASIYLAKGSLSSEEMSQLKNALQQLLGGAGLAFWTSVVGIACSMFFSRTLDGVSSIGEDHNRDFLRKVRSLVKVENQASGQLQQTQLIRSLNENLGKLVAGQDSFRQQALKQMGEEFRSALTQDAGKQIRSIAKSIDQITQTTLKSVDELKTSASGLLDISHQAGANLEKSLDHAGKKLETTIGKIAESMEESAQQSVSQMSVGILEAGVYTAKQLKGPANELAEVVQGLSESSRRASTDWKDAIYALEKISTRFESWDSIGASSRSSL